MGFLRVQRSKWRARLQSSSDNDDQSYAPSPSPSPSPLPTPVEPVELRYVGGPLGLTLQRSKSKWLDDVGPTKIAWHKDRRLGITFQERPSTDVDHAITVKELADDAQRHASICVGMALIGVNGEPIAGLELATVMDMIRSSPSPCVLAFTPPPSPIVVAEVVEVERTGVVPGDVLIAVDNLSMLGCSLQEASDAISVATPHAPVTLRFSQPQAVYPSVHSVSRGSDAAKKSLRNTLCIAAVAAALTV